MNFLQWVAGGIEERLRFSFTFLCPLPASSIVRFGIVVPLALVCLCIVGAIPVAARKGKLHIPAYSGIMLGAAAIAFCTGQLAGAEAVRNLPMGILISVVFFLLVATAFGSFLALIFYRRPPEE